MIITSIEETRTRRKIINGDNLQGEVYFLDIPKYVLNRYWDQAELRTLGTV